MEGGCAPPRGGALPSGAPGGPPGPTVSGPAPVGAGTFPLPFRKLAIISRTYWEYTVMTWLMNLSALSRRARVSFCGRTGTRFRSRMLKQSLKWRINMSCLERGCFSCSFLMTGYKCFSVMRYSCCIEDSFCQNSSSDPGSGPPGPEPPPPDIVPASPNVGPADPP